MSYKKEGNIRSRKNSAVLNEDFYKKVAVGKIEIDYSQTTNYVRYISLGKGLLINNEKLSRSVLKREL
jgi:hypothetical protein